MAVDPLALALAAPSALPLATTCPPAMEAARLVHPELEGMLGRVVKRIAWGGDGRRGTVRLELGSGELSGAVILVAASEEGLEIDVDLPASASAACWGERILARLRDRGLEVRRFDVR